MMRSLGLVLEKLSEKGHLVASRMIEPRVLPQRHLDIEVELCYRADLGRIETQSR